MTGYPNATRRAMLAKVHIAKKELGLSDDVYRSILLRVTGRESAVECPNRDIDRLLAEFRRLGWMPKPGFRHSDDALVRKLLAIWADMRPLLRDPSDIALRKFIRRQTSTAKNPQGIANPEWLDAKEATKVIEGLKGWRARLLAAQQKEAAEAAAAAAREAV